MVRPFEEPDQGKHINTLMKLIKGQDTRTRELIKMAVTSADDLNRIRSALRMAGFSQEEKVAETRAASSTFAENAASMKHLKLRI